MCPWSNERKSPTDGKGRPVTTKAIQKSGESMRTSGSHLMWSGNANVMCQIGKES